MPKSSAHPCFSMIERKGWIVNDPWDDEYGYSDDVDGEFPDQRWNKRIRNRQRAKRNRSDKKRTRRAERVESRDGTFRCKHCKTIVGAPISGGRHRNHCPLCLYSRHVDRKSPGDRSSDCRSMMPAVGLFTRRGGEQVLVHICSGCGVVRHNRVAADDNVVATMRLAIVTAHDHPDEQGDVAGRTA